MKYALKPEEQETIVRWYRDTDTAYVYTCDRTVMTKIDKRCKEYPDMYKLTKQDEYGKWYECPKDRIGFNTPPRKYSEETREKMRQRLAVHTKKSEA